MHIAKAVTSGLSTQHLNVLWTCKSVEFPSNSIAQNTKHKKNNHSHSYIYTIRITINIRMNFKHFSWYDGSTLMISARNGISKVMQRRKMKIMIVGFFFFFFTHSMHQNLNRSVYWTQTPNTEYWMLMLLHVSKLKTVECIVHCTIIFINCISKRAHYVYFYLLNFFSFHFWRFSYSISLCFIAALYKEIVWFPLKTACHSFYSFVIRHILTLVSVFSFQFLVFKSQCAMWTRMNGFIFSGGAIATITIKK